MYVARRNLVRARARSTLAVLTIVIGVVAIASLGSFGAAFEAAQMDAIGDVGNEVMVSPGEDSEGILTERDRRNVEGLAGDRTVVPIVQTRSLLGTTGEEVTIQAVGDPEALYSVDEGAVPSNWRSGALVGSSFADEHDIAPGQTIELDGDTYRVQAVLAPSGQLVLADPDDAVVVPTDAVDIDGYSSLVVRAETSREATALANEIEADFNEREERVSVLDFSGLADQFDEAFSVISQFLIGVGAISLIVAGISIANVMLMSAIERRAEIGVLRAVGYRRLDVLGIMLGEAMLLGVIGATIGLVLSALMTMGINSLLLGDWTAFQPAMARSFAIAFAFGIGASVVAGLYPAWKASRKPPVEALRG